MNTKHNFKNINVVCPIIKKEILIKIVETYYGSKYLGAQLSECFLTGECSAYNEAPNEPYKKCPVMKMRF